MSDLTSERINGIIRKIMLASLIVLGIVMLYSCVSSCGSDSGSRRSGGSSSSYHECYVCGERATEKIESYWYCSYHAAMVRAVTGD